MCITVCCRDEMFHFQPVLVEVPHQVAFIINYGMFSQSQK